MDCDFIPDWYHERQAMRRAVRFRSSGVVVMLALMGLWVLVHQHRIAAAEAMLQEVSLQEEQMRLLSAKQAEMQREQHRLQDRRRLVDVLSAHASPVVVLSDLSRRLPDSVLLTELSLNCASVCSFVSPKGVKTDARSASRMSPTNRPFDAGGEDDVPHQRLHMEGLAASLSDAIRFAALLEDSPLFDRISMNVKGSAARAGRRAERFELDCEMVSQQQGRP